MRTKRNALCNRVKTLPTTREEGRNEKDERRTNDDAYVLTNNLPLQISFSFFVRDPNNDALDRRDTNL